MRNGQNLSEQCQKKSDHQMCLDTKDMAVSVWQQVLFQRDRQVIIKF